MDDVKMQTEHLKKYVTGLKKRFKTGSAPENRKDRNFFLKVKEETAPMYQLLEQWEENALKLVKGRKVNVHPQQVTSTKENMELMLMHSYYMDVKEKRFMELHNSIIYIFDQLLREIERNQPASGGQLMNEQLLTEAKNSMKNAYVPYSNFRVGAALLAGSGIVYTGCNIENAAYPVSCCAERVAIFKAISNGEKDFSEMAVAADTKRPVPPCGSCRQVMSEFFSKSMPIHLTNIKNGIKTVTMEDLLPFSFEQADMEE